MIELDLSEVKTSKEAWQHCLYEKFFERAPPSGILKIDPVQDLETPKWNLDCGYSIRILWLPFQFQGGTIGHPHWRVMVYW